MNYDSTKSAYVNHVERVLTEEIPAYLKQFPPMPEGHLTSAMTITSAAQRTRERRSQGLSRLQSIIPDIALWVGVIPLLS